MILAAAIGWHLCALPLIASGHPKPCVENIEPYPTRQACMVGSREIYFMLFRGIRPNAETAAKFTAEYDCLPIEGVPQS